MLLVVSVSVSVVVVVVSVVVFGVSVLARVVVSHSIKEVVVSAVVV